jgi:hypothetical protein
LLKKLRDDQFVDVDVSPVIDSIRGLVDVLNEYESEHLQDEAVQSELDNLMFRINLISAHDLFYEAEAEYEQEEDEED